MLTLFGYLTAEFLARSLPASVAEAIARALARVVFALRPPARRRLEQNLLWLDGETRPTPAGRRRVTVQARAAFQNFALTVTDFLRRTPRSSDGRLLGDVEVRGAEHLEAAERSRRGIIVLSAHAGSWEWGAAFLAGRGRRVHVVARPQTSRWVERFYARRRRDWRVRRLCGRSLWLSASRVLRARGWVALAGDRDAEPAAGGDRPSVCAWVAALSRRTGALILPAVMLRLGDGRYAACFERPLTPEACVGGGYRAALRRLLDGHGDQWAAFEPLPEWLA